MSYTLTVDIASEQESIVDSLANKSELSRSKIKELMSQGAVWVIRGGKKERIRRAKNQLKLGDRVQLFYDPQISEQTPPDPILLYQDDALSVWVKPRGLLSSGTRFGDHCAIDRRAGQILDRPLYLVHRLDQFTVGLMVLAHNKKVAARLSDLFASREVTKKYFAVCHGALTEPLRIETPIDGKHAVTLVEPIENTGKHCLLDVTIETGRKHQIRIHLSTEGYSIVGDRLYGNALADNKRIEENEAAADLQLAAYALTFAHPETQDIMHFQLDTQFWPQLPQ